MARRKGRGTVVAQNRKARHDYAIEETFEAGIVLTGTEVKSLRQGRAAITEAYAGEREGELFLLNAHIPEYTAASRFNHEPPAAAQAFVAPARDHQIDRGGPTQGHDRGPAFRLLHRHRPGQGGTGAGARQAHL